MKSQLVILLILVSSLLATNADQQCDNLLQQCSQQCNQFKTKCSPDMITIRSCCDISSLPLNKAPSGVYKVESNCSCGSPFTLSVGVYCDMESGDGGWMTIQRNIKDGVSFFETKKWKEYQEGFGGLKSKKFWYGLEAVHCLTQTGQWELRIDFQFDNNTWSHLHYNTFSVGTESKEYPLTIGGFTGITPTDPFVTHPLNGQRFSTSDNDNDKNSGNCAASRGGWWHNSCDHIRPNEQPPQIYLNSKWYTMLSVETKIRPRDCITQ